MKKLKNNLNADPVADLASNQEGFITMIICIVLVLVVVIGFVYMRVSKVQQ